MPPVKSVGLVSKPGVSRATTVVPELVSWLHGHGLNVNYDEQTGAYLNDGSGMPRDEVPDGTDLVVVLGGDGTLLSAARAIAGRDIPILAVNLGGLGFLTAITVEQLFPQLERAIQRDYTLALRRLLHCEHVREAQILAQYEALNDVVLTKSSIARMIEVEMRIDGHLVCTYRADGLIIATPTGSTAYSLSAGGPIVTPTVSALCITPICPHTLTNRPVIVTDESVIETISRAGSETAYLTIDGQVGTPLLETNDTIICRRSEKCVQLVQPPRAMFFDVLREKLSWGER